MSSHTGNSAEATLGTDPWGGGSDGMFDRTDWNTREQGLQDAIRDFEQLLDRMGQGNEESSRLREVVRRLERRVFDLEDQLKERDDKNREALRKLDALAKEMTDWTQNEPLP